MNITEQVKQVLYEQGAALVGIGDMRPVQVCRFPAGISVAVPIPKHVIEDLKTAPTKEYYELYGSLNAKLNTIVTAGVGLIGKNCLLVTPQYGSAIRISSLLTDAPLECAQPMEKSRCGGCSLCVQHCPAGALKGTLWSAGMEREKIVDVNRCYQKQKEIMYASTGIATDLCGKCFAVCAYTQNYLKKQ